MQMTALPLGARVAKDQPARKKPPTHPHLYGERPSQSGWKCARCGLPFAHYETVQRHVDVEHGGGRIELVLNPSPGDSGDRTT